MKPVRLETIPTTNPQKVLVVELHYDKGGMNMLIGKQSPRGYVLTAKIMHLDPAPPTGRNYDPREESATVVEVTSRFSQKKLEELVRQGRSLPRYQWVVDQVLLRTGLAPQKLAA